MAMRPIPSMSMEDPWAGRLARMTDVRAQSLEKVPADVVFSVDLIEIQHHGPDMNYRMYLAVQGHNKGIEFPDDVELPFGITEMEIDPHSVDSTVMFTYELDDDQIADMALKGSFRKGFSIPSEMFQAEWALPVEVDLMIVEPDDLDEPPIVFHSVHERTELAYDRETSGYELHEHFPPLDPEVEAETEVRPRTPGLMVNEGPLNDLLAEYEERMRELTAETERRERAASMLLQDGSIEQSAVMPAARFDQLLQSIQERQEREQAELDAEAPEVQNLAQLRQRAEERRLALQRGNEAHQEIEQEQEQEIEQERVEAETSEASEERERAEREASSDLLADVDFEQRTEIEEIDPEQVSDTASEQGVEAVEVEVEGTGARERTPEEIERRAQTMREHEANLRRIKENEEREQEGPSYSR